MNNSIFAGVKQDFRKNKFIVIVLCVGMIPFLFKGYSQYLLILLLPYALKKWDLNSILSLIFGLFYGIGVIFAGIEQTPSSVIFNVFFPFILYQIGGYLGIKFRNKHSIIALFTLIILCFASTALYEIISDAIETRRLINISRIILLRSGVIRPATQYGLMLAILLGTVGLFWTKSTTQFDKSIKMIIAFFVILAIWCTIYLLNRTGIALGIISIFIAIFFQRENIKRRINIFILMLIIGGICLFFISQTEFFQTALELYESRDASSSEYNNASLGGRTFRYLTAIQYMIENPFGGMDGIFYDGHKTYAHNLWLDTGVKGGVICFILLIYWTYQIIYNVYKIYNKQLYNNFDTLFLVLLAVTILSESMVEPIIDSVPTFFWFMMLYLGVIKKIVKIKYSNNN